MRLILAQHFRKIEPYESGSGLVHSIPHPVLHTASMQSWIQVWEQMVYMRIGAKVDTMYIVLHDVWRLGDEKQGCVLHDYEPLTCRVT